MQDPRNQTLEQEALRYLAAELGPRAPRRLAFEAEFDEQPLEDEAGTSLFSFELEPGPGADRRGCAPEDLKHFVAVGRTEPNYFPAYRMDPDDAYSFHIGTRFMLGMEIRKVDASLEPPNARAAMRAFVRSYARGAQVHEETLAALFRCDEGYYAVYRLRIDDDEVYCMGADCPPGFYRMAQRPPQIALRLHLGKLIRSEARSAREADEPGTRP